jgi:hypothetical protein
MAKSNNKRIQFFYSFDLAILRIKNVARVSPRGGVKHDTHPPEGGVIAYSEAEDEDVEDV